MKTAINSGLPYITFKDTINRYNPMKDEGTIPAFNLCVESSSNITPEQTHTCILTSLVLPFIKDKDIPRLSATGIDILNILKNITKLDNDRSSKHIDKYSVVGLGTFGLHDYLASKMVNYEDSKETVDTLFARISYYAVKRSSELGKQFGNFKTFEQSTYKNGYILGRHPKSFNTNNGELDWIKLSEQTSLNMANAQLLAIAPGTSAALSLGVTANILPTFSKIFSERTKMGDIPRMPLYIDKYPMGYKEYKYVDHYKVNTVISTVAKYIDSSIAYEMVFDLNNEKHKDINYIWSVIKDAWKKEIKTIYYFRWIKPNSDQISEAEECITCGS